VSYFGDYETLENIIKGDSMASPGLSATSLYNCVGYRLLAFSIEVTCSSKLNLSRNIISRRHAEITCSMSFKGVRERKWLRLGRRNTTSMVLAS